MEYGEWNICSWQIATFKNYPCYQVATLLLSHTNPSIRVPHYSPETTKIGEPTL